jgi:hypothetical protein
MIATDRTRQCASCVHFRNDPAFLELLFKGLTSLSSGYGSARANDGICTLHDHYLSARSSCAKFCAVGASAVASE